MWIFDEETLRFLDVNLAAERAYGFSRDEFLAMTLSDIRPPDDVPALLTTLRTAGEWGDRLWTHVRKDGSPIVVTIYSAPTEFDGRPARAVTVRDVTEQERARHEAAEANMSLSAILAASPACIVSVDRHGRIETWNPATERICGKDLAQARGEQLWEALDFEPIAFLARFSKVLEGASIDNVEVVRWSDGAERHLLLSAAPLLDVDGKVRGAIVVLLDVSDRVRARLDLEAWNELLERRVSERTSELMAANDELEGFCASVSHDLRSPLRAIDGFSRAILEDYGEKLDDQGREFLQRVRSASWRMSSLIDDLLGLTRLTRAPLNRTLVDLSSLAEEVVSDLRDGSDFRVFDFTCADSAVVYGDHRMLRMLLSALLDNAWKFTSKTEGAKAEFRVEKLDGETVFVVEDNGVGFDMAYAGRLFRPFERLHKSSEFPGNGIGLAIASRIVAKHGGKIWAESAPDRGSVLRFTLDSLGAALDS